MGIVLVLFQSQETPNKTTSLAIAAIKWRWYPRQQFFLLLVYIQFTQSSLRPQYQFWEQSLISG